jgi:aryl-alcohol dehydrogenase-like predicted oxidoreductase
MAIMQQSNANRDRRRFLKAGLAGAAGMAVMPLALRAQTDSKPEGKQWKTVRRKLGKTGLELPIVSMGVMNADASMLVRAALDAGIEHLDSAHAYQNGRNETMVGKVVKERPRDSVVVSTKILASGKDRRTGLFGKDTSPDKFAADFETSLQRLGVDHVDILYLHSVVRREAALFEPILSVMQTLKRQGKARFLGVSTHRNEPEVIRAAIESNVYDVVLTAYNFLQPHKDEVGRAIEQASKAGLGVVAMKTQAGVYWDRDRKDPINMKAALKWVLRNEHVHTTIPGMTTFDQLYTDMSVMEDLNLTPQEGDDLRLGMQGGRSRLFCDQCGVCVKQCGHGVDVVSLMRGYMYAYGYRNLAVAKAVATKANPATLACSSCLDCTVRCPRGFDVRERAMDIARIHRVPDEFVA